jgi:riboflavin synthase
MFTGIVEDRGRIRAMARRGTSARLEIEPEKLHVADFTIGESLAIDGCCLTVVSTAGNAFALDVSHETLLRTTLGQLRAGHLVNLERALRVGAALGGHFVLGHVDGVGDIQTIDRQGDAWDVTFRAPSEVAEFLIPKGSVAIDGISLTVNRCTDADFSVTLIPHTRAVTTLGAVKGVGAKVNLEADVLGKYVKRLLGGREGARNDWGFV